MKKMIYQSLLMFAGLLITVHLNATVYRVNNNPGIDADYESFSAAIADVNPGDTLYLEGSPLSYGNIVFTKPLVVFGPGYFLEENPETQVNKISAKVGSVTFNSGGVGSKIMGLEVQNTTIIKASDISITYCRTKSIEFDPSVSITNIHISRNYIYGNNVGLYYNDSFFINGLMVTNNYIQKNSTSDAVSLNDYVTAVFNNNIFVGDVNAYNSTFSNNIQTYENQGIHNNTYFNNIGSSDQFPADNGNQQYVNMDAVLVGPTGNTTDGQWQLKTGSPAFGAGVDGVDCGIFGEPLPMYCPVCRQFQRFMK
ncbi:MAG: hypothetical protein R2764_07195 [Bacteroidales bacterium]